MSAIHHDLAFESAGQLEAVEEHVSWIEVSVATAAIAYIVAVTSIDFVARSSWRATQFHPRHLNVADVGVTVTRIEVEHGVLLR